MQFGGECPWWDRDKIEMERSDHYNTVSLKIEKRRQEATCISENGDAVASLFRF